MSRHRAAQDLEGLPDRSPTERIAVLRREHRRVGWVPADGARTVGPEVDGTPWAVLAPPVAEWEPGTERDPVAGWELDHRVGEGPGYEAADESDGLADEPDVSDGPEDPKGLGVPDGSEPRRRPFGQRWRRLSETWVPEPMRDARVDPGRRGALILSLVAALAAVAAAIGVWRDRPQPRPVQPVASAPTFQTVTGSGPAGPGPAPASAQPGPASAPAPTSTGPSVIAVSVTGLVRHPGLVELPAGSRVADAIAAAGGLADGGSVTGLNLAAPLSDGDSVVVGAADEDPPTAAGPGGGSGPGAAAGGAPAAGNTDPAPVDLNSADATALETLPGVGPVMAGNILAWREQNGPFTSVEQLQEVSGIGPSRFAQLQPLVTLG